MLARLQNEWVKQLSPILESQSFATLSHFLADQYQKTTVYPKKENIFRALNTCPFDDVSVVIVGQDPYHNPGQAEGFAFSVPNGISLPPSLRNIYTEIESDIGTPKNFSRGHLGSWAEQGVLLLNSVLTVRENEPGSHAGVGWEEFTDEIIKKISEEKDHVVFLLWGAYAQNKGAIIDRTKHLVLETSHPSPLAAYRGFIGCKHFSQSNDYLIQQGKNPIEW